MTTPIWQVDAFTDRPFSGNPAAVCVPAGETDDAWMQAVAAEMNLSETAFVFRRMGDDGWNLRWFTPQVEVDLCGHATLATAHTLWTAELLDPDEAAVFHTRSGKLTCRLVDDEIRMDFPARPVKETSAPAGLLAALGLSDDEVVFVGRNVDDLLVEVTEAAVVDRLQPQMAALARIDGRGVIVTAPADDERYDFVSRFFGPAVGVPEDPVTGSAHCGLGPYWAAKLGRDELVGYQASARGGVVRVTCDGERVVLGGRAVVVLRGMLV